jgi:hypothetical protein
MEENFDVLSARGIYIRCEPRVVVARVEGECFAAAATGVHVAVIRQAVMREVDVRRPPFHEAPPAVDAFITLSS